MSEEAKNLRSILMVLFDYFPVLVVLILVVCGEKVILKPVTIPKRLNAISNFDPARIIGGGNIANWRDLTDDEYFYYTQYYQWYDGKVSIIADILNMRTLNQYKNINNSISDQLPFSIYDNINEFWGEPMSCTSQLTSNIFICYGGISESDNNKGLYCKIYFNSLNKWSSTITILMYEMNMSSDAVLICYNNIFLIMYWDINTSNYERGVFYYTSIDAQNGNILNKNISIFDELSATNWQIQMTHNQSDINNVLFAFYHNDHFHPNNIIYLFNTYYNEQSNLIETFNKITFIDDPGFVGAPSALYKILYFESNIWTIITKYGYSINFNVFNTDLNMLYHDVISLIAHPEDVGGTGTYLPISYDMLNDNDNNDGYFGLIRNQQSDNPFDPVLKINITNFKINSNKIENLGDMIIFQIHTNKEIDGISACWINNIQTDIIPKSNTFIVSWWQIFNNSNENKCGIAQPFASIWSAELQQ